MNMKTLSLITIISAVGTVTTQTLARPAESEDKQPGRRTHLIEKFDADGDGQLNEQERRDAREAFRAHRLQRDADGTGALDDGENVGRKDGKRKGRKLRRRHGGRHQALLEKFDADGDGTLDKRERQAAREARRSRRLERIEKFDTDGDGKIDDDERAAARESRRARMLEKLDADGDGTLSDDEKKQDRNARRKHHREHRRRRDVSGPRELELPLEPASKLNDA